ncbi:hypothetical protein O6H91_10G006500 [Diphasiastrum complanatum]|uniref:Uncharacterized protein n=1 Tax=Diphasiastrum complanatum TaxID=34168 RepID=A0ACC2CE74_DIPCM|nr:hypothetical protein O6H91_10G006500 [Diphasiastrum complanatum]
MPPLPSMHRSFNISFHRFLLPPLVYFHSHAPSRLLHPAASSIHSGTQPKQKSDAADMLEALLDAAEREGSIFKVVGVVTQPQSSSRSRKKHVLSPVAQRAFDRGFPSSSIFLPSKAGEESFLSSLKELQPDLCITAAYGNILPKRFLDIPPCGTVNVHPSLLPLYRGAAPVQRAIQDGVKVTGVTIAYTVRSLDSGPIIAWESLEVDSDIKAPKLQSLLFAKGTRLLLRELPSILDGLAVQSSKEQDHSSASLAPKISVEESWLSFDETALAIHNKVRAFSGWPGTKALFLSKNSVGELETIEVKIITTRVKPYDSDVSNSERAVWLKGNSLVLCCGDRTVLEIVELQPPGKKVMSGRDFWNGLQGRQLLKFKP